MVVTAALLRHPTHERNASCLSLTVSGEGDDLIKAKAVLTGRASIELYELKLDLYQLFQSTCPTKKVRKLFQAIAQLPHLKILRFQYRQPPPPRRRTLNRTNNSGAAGGGTGTELQRLPVHLLTLALTMTTTKSCEKNGGLCELELDHVNLTGTENEFELFYTTLQTHPTLETIRFCSSGICSSSNIHQFLMTMANMSNLQNLVLYSQGQSPWGYLSASSLKTLLSKCITLKQFQHLILYDSNAGCFNFLQNEQIVAVAQALTPPSPSSPSPPPIETTTLATSTSINHNFLLQELMISCWPLGKQGVNALSQMLRVNTSLKELVMVVYELEQQLNTISSSNNENNNNSTKAEAITENITSSSSQANNNNDASSILVPLAHALQVNNTLSCLELHGLNDVSTSTEYAFQNMMKTNYTITKLKLFNTETYSKLTINFYLKLNKVGRNKLLGTTNVSKDEWINVLSQVRHDLSCIFYFISTNPLFVHTTM